MNKKISTTFDKVLVIPGSIIKLQKLKNSIEQKTKNDRTRGYVGRNHDDPVVGCPPLEPRSLYESLLGTHHAAQMIQNGCRSLQITRYEHAEFHLAIQHGAREHKTQTKMVFNIR